MSIAFNGKSMASMMFNGKLAAQIFFGAKLIWQKIQKLLRMGEERWVCIEYVADRTETVSDISIFLDRTTNAGYMWVMEDNHCAALSTDQGDAQVEKYGLTAYLRTHRFTNLKFYEGHTYYICWKHGQYVSDSSTPDYFAYYQGLSGNYKKICMDGNTNVLVSNCGMYEYVGELSTLEWDTVMRYPEGKAFYSSEWNSDAASGRTSSYPTSSSDPSVALYVGQVDCSNMSADKDRQAALCEKFFTMRYNDVMYDKESTSQSSKFYRRLNNEIGTTYHGRKNTIASLGNVDTGEIFYWTGGYVEANFGDNSLYKPKVSLLGLVGEVPNSEEYNNLTSVKKMAYIYMLAGNEVGNLFTYLSYLDVGGDYANYFQRTYVYKVVNNGNNHITSLTPITEEPTSGIGWLGIYYKGQTTAEDGWLDANNDPITDECIVINVSSEGTPTWEKATKLSRIFEQYKDSNNNSVTCNNMLNSVSFNDIATDDTGTVRNNALVKISQVNTFTNQFKNTQIDSSHKKHYLAINDREV